MTSDEAARNDLYNGLADVLGPQRAETLMTYLPAYDPADVATGRDVGELRSEFKDLRTELKEEIAGLRSEMKTELETMNARLGSMGERIDRVLLTLVAGLFVIVAAIIGLFAVVISAL